MQKTTKAFITTIVMLVIGYILAASFFDARKCAGEPTLTRWNVFSGCQFFTRTYGWVSKAKADTLYFSAKQKQLKESQ